MIILNYDKKNHKNIVCACAGALKKGRVVAYPTDTSYGLAVDATNLPAIKKLYRIKERQSAKPVHVIAPSLSYAKKTVKWNAWAGKLAAKFWPGALTLVLRLRAKSSGLNQISANGYLGMRIPDNKIALDLSRVLKQPITATSANPSAEKSGGYDSFSAKDVVKQFQDKKYKPDIIIDAGRLPKCKPSTLVRIDGDRIDVLRKGPITEREIQSVLNSLNS